MAKNERIADLLEKHFAACEQAKTPTHYFLAFFDYWELCLGSAPVNACISGMFEAKDHEEAILDAELEKAKAETLRARDAIENYVRKHKITSESIAKGFAEIPKYLDGRIISSAPVARSISDKLHFILLELKESGHKKFTNQYYHFIDEAKTQFDQLILSPTLNRYYDLKENFERESQLRGWDALAATRLTHYAMGKARSDHKELYEEYMKNTEDWNLQMQLMNVGGVARTWDGVRRGERETSYIFDLERTKANLVRLHNIFLRALASSDQDGSAEKGVDDELLHGFKPALRVEKGQLEIQLYNRRPWMNVGGQTTKKARLLRILFNADGDPAKPYSPIWQTSERVYHFLEHGSFDMDEDADPLPSKAMRQAIENHVKELQRGALRGIITAEFADSSPAQVRIQLKAKPGSRNPLEGLRDGQSAVVAPKGRKNRKQ